MRDTHPNYFIVLAGEALVHAGLWFAAAYGTHNTPSWFFFYSVRLGNYNLVTLVGLVHGLIFALMVAGMYWRWSLARLGLLLSVTVYTMQGCLYLAAIIRGLVVAGAPAAPLEGTIYTLGLILLSSAAFREPVVPGRYDARDAT